jgi:hypothetical protein
MKRPNCIIKSREISNWTFIQAFVDSKGLRMAKPRGNEGKDGRIRSSRPMGRKDHLSGVSITDGSGHMKGVNG